eukprot:1820073-Rhodomonas_salina.1
MSDNNENLSLFSDGSSDTWVSDVEEVESVECYNLAFAAGVADRKSGAGYHPSESSVLHLLYVGNWEECWDRWFTGYVNGWYDQDKKMKELQTKRPAALSSMHAQSCHAGCPPVPPLLELGGCSSMSNKSSGSGAGVVVVGAGVVVVVVVSSGTHCVAS